MSVFSGVYNVVHSRLSRCIHTTAAVDMISKLTRCRVVDNSAIGRQAMLEGKPPKCIHIYKPGKGHRKGTTGDKILVAIKGQMKKAYIVGVKRKPKAFQPRFDTNNIVLIDEAGNPLGTRIHVPIPAKFREKPEFAKILAIAPRLV